MKLIDNLPNHLKDKKDYLLKLKESINSFSKKRKKRKEKKASINIPIVCIKCRKYEYHAMECGKKEKAKKGKDKK